MNFKVERKYYIIEIQYLGFRFHGFQHQPNVKTIELAIKRTIAYVLKHKNFKILASGRTDKMVSANQTYIELFIDDEPLQLSSFLKDFNINLPADIKALSIKKTDDKFNIIKDVKLKEYQYLFSFGNKNHPFCASLMTNFDCNLDINLMKDACKFLIGTHDFYNFIYKPNENTLVTISNCKIELNNIYSASFFPKESFILTIQGKGFKRNMVRLIMAKLVSLGKGEISLTEFKNLLNSSIKIPITYIAPPSGLILNKVEY